MHPIESPADATSATIDRSPSEPYAQARFDQPPHDGPRRHYVICATARSGSTLLCDLLAASGAMGVPWEYVNPDGLLKMLAQRLGAVRDGRIGLAEYLAAVMRVRTTPNGVFGIKMMWLQAQPFVERRLLSRLFPQACFVFVTRRDRIAQAVSRAIALSSGSWINFGAAQRQAEITLDDVRKSLHDIARMHEAWEAFFAINGIAPLRVDYESLVADSDAACRSICRLVGVETGHRFALEGAMLTRQGTALNEEWTRRARQELAGY